MKRKCYTQKSLKIKITLWYAMFMLLCTVLIMIVTEITTRLNTDKASGSNLEKTVNLVATEISNEKTYDFEEMLKNIIDSQYIGIYGSEGNLMAGTIPDMDNKPLPFMDDALQTQIISAHVYYIFDRKIYTGKDYVWVRGYVQSISSADTIRKIGIFMLCFLPVIAMIMLLVGFFLTGKALKPLNLMIEEMKDISVGDDLNKRLELPDTQNEIYQMGETMNQMLERLHYSFQREKQFTSDVSHELRTPIAVILAQCEIMEDSLLPEELQQDLEVIQRQTIRMNQMVEELLQLSRLDRGDTDTDVEKFDFSKLVLELVSEQRMLHAEDEVYDIKVEENIRIYGKEKLIMRACTNLLNNAYQYGNGRIQVRLKREKSSIIFSVSDNGKGIEPENMKRIWDRFYQEESSRLYKGGFGLGLAMVKSIVELHRGFVWCESEKGQGSTFFMKIPIE